MKSYYEMADIVYSNTNIATDADDVATMSIESEGNFNQAWWSLWTTCFAALVWFLLTTNKNAKKNLSFVVPASHPVVSTNNSVVWAL